MAQRGAPKTSKAKTPMANRQRRFGADEVAEHKANICTHLGLGKPLSWYCAEPGAPTQITVYEWMRQDPDFDLSIARSRESGYDNIAEDALKIADSEPLAVFDEAGNKRIDQGEIAHRKLRIETRLKLLAKWNPKKYGDRTTVAGDAEAPVKVEVDFGIFDALLQNVALKKLDNE